MNAWAALAVVLATAIGMEAVATLVHRHLMHGPLWSWHRSHHEPRAPGDGPFERNDRFALVFAAAAMGAMAASAALEAPWLWWMGLGATLYGLVYTVVHDGWVHRRGPWPPRWRAPRRGYLARLVQAHRLHHAVSARDGAVSFGFLYAPAPARLAAQLRRRRAGSGAGEGEGEGEGGNGVGVEAGAASRVRQARIGLALAAAIVAAWAALLGHGLFRQPLDGPAGVAGAGLLMAALTWLEVGLFIVAHDAMHGSLAPGRPRTNRAVGRLALLLYAGFSYDRFLPAHHDHHRHPGSDRDPDFHRGRPGFWRWYADFLGRYMGWREVAGLLVVSALLATVATPLRAMLFWMVPALLASLQLFAFGTWLPHRPVAERSASSARRAEAGRLSAGLETASPAGLAGRRALAIGDADASNAAGAGAAIDVRRDAPFADHHHARSNDYGTLASLATCFHFGYHLEHHRHPGAPWWRLPAVRQAERAVERRGSSGAPPLRAAPSSPPRPPDPAGASVPDQGRVHSP